MDNKFTDKSASILVITGPVDLRGLITGELRNAGFTDIRGIADIESALKVLESEPIDWIVSPVYADSKINAFQLLRMTAVYPQLRSTRITLLVKEEEEEMMDKALELGLLSWQPASSTTDGVKAGFDQLFENFEASNWNPCLTAACYVRDLMVKKQRYEALLKFEQQLLELFPGEPQLLCFLGQAQILNGKKDQGLETLAQVATISEHLLPLINKIYEATGTKSKENSSGSKNNLLPVGSVCVVQPDAEKLQAIETILQGLGVPKIETFQNPALAWEFLNKNEVEFVIHAWDQPILPGAVFVQRVRKKFPTIPVMVTATQLTEEDDNLLTELGISFTFQLEYTKQNLSQSIIWLIQQDRLPTDPKFLESKIYQYVYAKKMSIAEELKNNFMTNRDVPTTRKKAVEAYFSYIKHEYPKALGLYLDVLKKEGVNIKVLHFIGKCLMQLQNFPAALQCFENAQTLSPFSIDRLCEIATAQVESGNGAGADKALAEARLIDDESTVIAETEAEIAILNKDPDAAKRLMEEMSSISGILAFLNNRGVALTRCDRITEGIIMYRQALEAIPTERKEEKAILLYNQALALVRTGEYQKALDILKECIELKVNRMLPKAKSLGSRLKASISENTPFKLLGTDIDARAYGDKGTITKEHNKEIQADFNRTIDLIQESIAIRKGTLCCHKIFHSNRIDAKIDKLTENLPTLKKLKASNVA